MLNSRDEVGGTSTGGAVTDMANTGKNGTSDATAIDLHDAVKDLEALFDWMSPIG